MGVDESPALRIAPLWRRMVAAVVNAMVGLSMIAGVIGAIMGWTLRRYGRRDVGRLVDRFTDNPLSRFMARFGLEMQAYSVYGVIAERNSQSLGYRIAGIRRVDGRTGGPVSVRSALVQVVAHRTLLEVGGRLGRARAARTSDQMASLEPGLKKIQAAEYDSREEKQRALTEFYREHNVNPLASCPWWLLPGMVLPSVFALWSRRNQTAYDWLAGTVVIVDRLEVSSEGRSADLD